MSEVTEGRRGLRKARTREEIRTAAQRLYAERGFDEVTSADIATAAGVAVQTVFNHFGSKEELFFADRTPWVEGLPRAVTDRPPGTDPLTALREYLEADLAERFDHEGRPENRSYVEVLARSPALQARERSLVELAATRLAEALLAAIPAGSYADTSRQTDPGAAGVLAQLTASLFLVAGRALVLEHRRVLLAPGADETARRSAERLITAVLTMLEDGLRALTRQELAAPTG